MSVEENKESQEEVEVQSSATKAETTIARAKAATMVIGAIATAATAIWGAVRQPPEPGAKIAYEVLKEALLQERNRYDKLADELEEVRNKAEACDKKYDAITEQIRVASSCSGKRNNATGRSPASITNGSAVAVEEIAPSSPSSPNAPKTKNLPPPLLPKAEELGL